MAGPESLNPESIDYGFGVGCYMEVDRMMAYRADDILFRLEPHFIDRNGLTYEQNLKIPEIGSPEFHDTYQDKLVEIRDNLQIIEDSDSGNTFEITIANEDALRNGEGSIVQVSTSNSTIPDNSGNAIELALNAIVNPDNAVIYVASPGNGGSSPLSDEEMLEARIDGALVEEVENPHEFGSVDKKFYEPFPTIKALARALLAIKADPSKVVGDASGAHYSSALMSALPEKTVADAFLYNPTNVSPLSSIGYKLGMLREIIGQRKYAASAEPMAVTDEAKEQAKKILGKDFGTKATQIRSGTFSPSKMHKEAQIYRGGWGGGRAARNHLLAALRSQPNAFITYAFPEFSPNYRNIEEIVDFMEFASTVGKVAVGNGSVRGFKFPVGQYWHSHHPMARLAMQDEAFNR